MNSKLMGVCINHLHVTGPVSSLDDFFWRAIGEAPVFPPGTAQGEPTLFLNFHSLVPIPADLLNKPYSEEVRTWEIENWGCGGQTDEITFARRSDREFHYRFVTYDSPPTKWVKSAGGLFPMLTFELEYWNFTSDVHGVFRIRSGLIAKNSEVNWHEEAAELDHDDPIMRLMRSLGLFD